MEQRINRVNEAARSWEQTAKEHALIYPRSVGTPATARTNLRQLEIILARFRNTNDPGEKISLLFLKDEVSRLRNDALKSKYNWRYIANFLLKPFTVGRTAAKLNRLENKNSENFISNIRRSVFGPYADEIQELIKQGKKNFTYTVPYHGNENEITTYKLNIGYDPIGGHNFKSCQASFVNNLSPGDSRQHNMSTIIGGPDHHAMSNLLAGRYVYDIGIGWRQLDLTDKDETGRYKMKNVAADDFKTKEHCENLPIWDKLSSSQQALLPIKLELGDRVQTKFELDGVKTTVFLEASPIKNEILATNEKGKPIDLNKLMEPKQINQSQEQKMQLVKAPSMEKKRHSSKVSNQRTTKQVLGKGVKPRASKIPR